MDARITKLFADRQSDDAEVRYQALLSLLEASSVPVDWAYQVWDSLAAGLVDRDNHVRAFAAQMLARLSISDPDRRMEKVFDQLVAVTRDDRTVTARHSLQSFWRVGLGGTELRKRTLAALVLRFEESASIKQGSIYRPDIIEGLRQLFDATGDRAVESQAEMLIASETDAKQQKKLRAAWRRGGA